MGIYSDNFYSWMDKSFAAEKAAMDAKAADEFKESNIRREPKGSEKAGRFAKKPETLAKEDDRDRLDAKKGTTNYRALREAQASKVNGMGTFDLKTGQPITNRHGGYQVSFQEATTENPNHGSYISNQEYDRKVEALKKELGTEPELGHWDENEISFHCDSLDKALEVARRHNQEAIWNWAKEEPIYNEDFVGRTHWVDRDNHATKKYHAHKPSGNNQQSNNSTTQP